MKGEDGAPLQMTASIAKALGAGPVPEACGSPALTGSLGRCPEPAGMELSPLRSHCVSGKGSQGNGGLQKQEGPVLAL